MKPRPTLVAAFSAGRAAVLVVGACLVLGGCSLLGSASPSPVAGPSGSRGTVSPPPSGKVYDMTGTAGAAFFSPSGNIVCAIASPYDAKGLGTGSVRCDIAQVAYDVPKTPKNCFGDYGRDFSLGKRAELGCITDTIAPEAVLGRPTGGAPSYTTWFDPADNPRVHLASGHHAGAGLGYGNAIVDGALRCASRTTGVTCRNTKTGKGFELSREGYRLF